MNQKAAQDETIFLSNLKEVVDYFLKEKIYLHVIPNAYEHKDHAASYPSKYALHSSSILQGKWVQLARAVATKKGSLKSSYDFKKVRGEMLNAAISPELEAELVAKINDTRSVERRITLLPSERTFVYCDISDFSTMPARHQALVINALIQVVDHVVANVSRGPWSPPEARLCIGDGYIFAFDDVTSAVWFSCLLGDTIQRNVAMKRLPVDFHFRMSVHTGEVFFFWDEGRKDWNYIGNGINGGQRVGAIIGKDLDDVIFASYEVIEHIRAKCTDVFQKAIIKETPQHILENTENKGRHKDKHGKSWRVFNINFEKIIAELMRETLLVREKNYRGEEIY